MAIMVAFCLVPSHAVDGPIVLLLGDSMTAGQGVYPFLEQYPNDTIGNPAVLDDTIYEFGGSPGDDCWREVEKAAGAFVAADAGLEFVNLACAAARAEGVERQWEYAKRQFSENLAYEDSIILISFGANDSLQLGGGAVRSFDSIKVCFQGILPILQTVNTDSITDWLKIEQRIEATIRKIVTEAPESATIRVVGYPLQFRPSFDILCWSIAAPCARTYDALMSRLNSVLKSVTNNLSATTPNVQFVDIEDEDLLPFGVCSLTSEHIRDFTLDLRNGLFNMRFSAASFHPKESAQMAIASRIGQSLQNR